MGAADEKISQRKNVATFSSLFPTFIPTVSHFGPIATIEECVQGSPVRLLEVASMFCMLH